MYCNVDLGKFYLVLNKQVSIQRLQENGDRRYKGGIAMVIFAFQVLEFASTQFLMMWFLLVR